MGEHFRAITMFITVLPKPDESYICAAKIEDLTPYGRLSHIPTAAMHYNTRDRRQ